MVVISAENSVAAVVAASAADSTAAADRKKIEAVRPYISAVLSKFGTLFVQLTIFSFTLIQQRLQR